MGVRGTEFVVDAPARRPGQPPQSSRITVLQGEVEVSHTAAQISAAGGPARTAGAPPVMLLKAGQQVTAMANAPLPTQPVTLDSGSLGKVASSSKVADNTFTRSVVIDTSSNGALATSSGQNGSSSNGQRAPASQSGTTSSASSTLGGLLSSTGSNSAPPALPPPPQGNNFLPPPIPGANPPPLVPVNTVLNATSTVTISIH